MKPHVKICTTTLFCSCSVERCVQTVSVMLLLNMTILLGLFRVKRELAGLKLSNYFCSIYFDMRKLRLLKILLMTSERKKSETSVACKVMHQETCS